MQIIYTIPQNHCVVIERFGKFRKIQNQGLNIRIPILDKIKMIPEWEGETIKKNFLIELSEQKSDTNKRQCQTKDNVTVFADAVIYWRITDPNKAVYNIDILPASVRDSGLNALRANIGTMMLDQVLSQREMLNEKISAQLSEVSQKWGIVINRVEIQELEYDKSTQEAMLQEMTAERKRRALISEAEGEAQATLTKAKAAADAAIMVAEGNAKALEITAKAESLYLAHLIQRVGQAQAGQILLTQKTLSGYDVISKNPSNKVFLPSNVNALVDTMGG
jgi:regulator of protease activity HflC (stomatin/prohibitin superfamily)